MSETRVDFPLPVPPITETFSPGSILKETLLTAASVAPHI